MRVLNLALETTNCNKKTKQIEVKEISHKQKNNSTTEVKCLYKRKQSPGKCIKKTWLFKYVQNLNP